MKITLKIISLTLFIVTFTVIENGKASPTSLASYENEVADDVSENDIYHVVKREKEVRKTEITSTGSFSFFSSIFDVVRIKKVCNPFL